MPILRSAHIRRGSLFAVAIAILIGVGSVANSGGFHSAPGSAPAAISRTTPVSDQAPAISNASCSAGACHGSPATDSLVGVKPIARMWHRSASHWQAADPHAGAYALLTDKPNRPVTVSAESMLLRLGVNGPARNEVRCLVCHTDPALTSPRAGIAADLMEHLRSDGVGCQACHGRAETWLVPHTAGTLAGMTPLRAVVDRAQVCAGCHIGAPASEALPARQVDHDLLAAGHPRLTYDFAEHHRRLPKHWTEKAPGANFEIRLWLVGQVVEAEAVCRQLADRAAQGAWPELAEFRCAACHHDLAGESRDSPIGYLRWRSSWYLLTTGGSHPPLDALLEMMNGRKRPQPDVVRTAAEKALAELKLRRAVIAATADAELPQLLRAALAAAPAGIIDGEDLVSLLQAMAAWERNRKVAAADPADFEAAYESARKREWKELKRRLDGLLLRLQQAE